MQQDSLDVQRQKVHLFFIVCNRVFDILAALSSCAMFLVVIAQITGRLSGNPAPWTEETTRFIFIWMVFLGIAIGFRRAESARVTYFINLMPKFMNNLAFYIYLIASVAFFAFMFFTGTELVAQQLNTNEIGSALMIPMWIIGISIPVSSVLAILGIIESAIYHRKLI